MVIVYNQITLLGEPHVSYSLFVKRPATRVDHERDHEKVNSLTNQFTHVFSGKGFCGLSAIEQQWTATRSSPLDTKYVTPIFLLH